MQEENKEVTKMTSLFAAVRRTAGLPGPDCFKKIGRLLYKGHRESVFEWKRIQRILFIFFVKKKFMGVSP